MIVSVKEKNDELQKIIMSNIIKNQFCLFIKNRQVGYTTAISKIINDLIMLRNYTVGIVLHSRHATIEMTDMLSDSWKNNFIIINSPKDCLGRRFDFVFFDELNFIKNYKEIFTALNVYSLNECKIVSSITFDDGNKITSQDIDNILIYGDEIGNELIESNIKIEYES